MKQIKITTTTDTKTYPLSPGEPAPAIRGGKLVFHSPLMGEVMILLADLVEYSVATAPKLTKAERLSAELAAAEAEMPKFAADVFDAANGGTDANELGFVTALADYAQAVADFRALREKVERFKERRAATEARKASGETKAKKPATEKTPKPKAKKTAKA